MNLGRWPVVTVTAFPQALSDEEMARWATELADQAQCDPRPYALVLDLRAAVSLGGAQARRLAAQLQSAAADNAGAALVLSSGLARSFMGALLWLSKPAHPIEVFASLNEAVAWAEERVESLTLERDMAAGRTSVPEARKGRSSTAERHLRVGDITTRLNTLERLHVKGMLNDQQLAERRRRVMEDG